MLHPQPPAQSQTRPLPSIDGSTSLRSPAAQHHGVFKLKGVESEFTGSGVAWTSTLPAQFRRFPCYLSVFTVPRRESLVRLVANLGKPGNWRGCLLFCGLRRKCGLFRLGEPIKQTSHLVASIKLLSV